MKFTYLLTYLHCVTQYANHRNEIVSLYYLVDGNMNLVPFVYL